MPFSFYVALRYLRSKKRHRALSVNTVISIVGVTFGVAALIATLAVMNGAMEEIRDKILGTNSHVVVSARSGSFAGYQEAVAEISAHEQVMAATPFIYGQVMITSEFGVQGVVLRGVDPEGEGVVTELGKYMQVGDLGRLTTGAAPGFDPDVEEITAPGPVQPGIILGRELALSMGALVGSSINVLTPTGEVGPMGILPKIRPFTVVGVFSSGMYEYDTSLAYVSIPAAQNFLDMGDRVSGVEVRLSDFETAPEVAASLRGALGDDFSVRDWRDLNRNFFEALDLEKRVMFLILTLIIVVAAFNIVGTLVMMVIEKGREISILKAMGGGPGLVLKVFTLIGLMIGGVGTAIGLPLGLAICWVVARNFELPGDVYYISRIPVHLVWSDAVAVCVAALVISLLAALYPAWQASKLNPADGLRYE